MRLLSFARLKILVDANDVRDTIKTLNVELPYEIVSCSDDAPRKTD